MGDILFKRFLLLALSLCCVFNITVNASNYFSVKTDDEFLVYGKDDEKLASVLGVSVTELKEECGENVIFLAANKDNSKQIRLTVAQNDFTNSVVNISSFSNDKISQLVPQITEIDDLRGEIVNKNGQKFIKTELRTSDSGGEFILTEYITVADRRSFVLSFYTDLNVNRDYIKKTFEGYNCDYFVNEKVENEGENISEKIVPALTIVFGIVTVVIGSTVVFDLVMKKRLKVEEETEKEEPESQNETEEKTESELENGD